ncbi:CPBP family intramembrane metalloprotease [Erysipelothrix sp. HDW6B]|nr:CPBP family intramembrane metalloprotease [Erysipelothrix sp. HDW6B]
MEDTYMVLTQKKNALSLFIATAAIGITYQIFATYGLPGPIGLIIGVIWNMALGGLAAYFFDKDTFLDRLKRFNWKVLAWGIPATILVGVVSGLIYASLFGKPTTNSIAGSVNITMMLTQVPFMLMGEEILSTNIVRSLRKANVSFFIASLVSAVLFALWHIPAYGFNPMQLLITIVPLRLLLNYIWERSESIWVSWICHILYDFISFIPFLIH